MWKWGGWITVIWNGICQWDRTSCHSFIVGKKLDENVFQTIAQFQYKALKM